MGEHLRAAYSPALPDYAPDADAAVIATARENCARRLRDRGHASEADAFEAGERDFSWALRHELRLLSAA